MKKTITYLTVPQYGRFSWQALINRSTVLSDRLINMPWLQAANQEDINDVENQLSAVGLELTRRRAMIQDVVCL